MFKIIPGRVVGGIALRRFGLGNTRSAAVPGRRISIVVSAGMADIESAVSHLNQLVNRRYSLPFDRDRLRPLYDGIGGKAGCLKADSTVINLKIIDHFRLFCSISKVNDLCMILSLFCSLLVRQIDPDIHRRGNLNLLSLLIKDLYIKKSEIGGASALPAEGFLYSGGIFLIRSILVRDLGHGKGRAGGNHSLPAKGGSHGIVRPFKSQLACLKELHSLPGCFRGRSCFRCSFPAGSLFLSGSAPLTARVSCLSCTFSGCGTTGIFVRFILIFIAFYTMSMLLFSADKDFFIAGVSVLMPVCLFKRA